MVATLDRRKAFELAQARERAMREKGEIDALEDAARSGLSGLGEGVAGTIGLGGDLPGMVLRGGDWLGRKTGIIDDTPEHRAWMDDTVKAVDDWNPMPTSSETLDVMNDYTRGFGLDGEGLFEHDPRTGLGKVVRTMGELAPGVLTGPAGLMRKGAMWLGSSLGSEAAGKLAEGSGYEDWARFAGAVAGGGIPRFRRAQPSRTEAEWRAMLDDAEARVAAVGERNPAEFVKALLARDSAVSGLDRERVLKGSGPSGRPTREDFVALAQSQAKMAQLSKSMQNAVRRAAGDDRVEKTFRRMEDSLPRLKNWQKWTAVPGVYGGYGGGKDFGRDLGSLLGPEAANVGEAIGGATGAIIPAIVASKQGMGTLARAVSNRNVRNAEREIRTGLRPGANRAEALKMVTRALLQNQGIQTGL